MFRDVVTWTILASSYLHRVLSIITEDTHNFLKEDSFSGREASMGPRVVMKLPLRSKI
jgi:hypothetical protein